MKLILRSFALTLLLLNPTATLSAPGATSNSTNKLALAYGALHFGVNLSAGFFISLMRKEQTSQVFINGIVGLPSMLFLNTHGLSHDAVAPTRGLHLGTAFAAYGVGALLGNKCRSLFDAAVGWVWEPKDNDGVPKNGGEIVRNEVAEVCYGFIPQLINGFALKKFATDPTYPTSGWAKPAMDLAVAIALDFYCISPIKLMFGRSQFEHWSDAALTKEHSDVTKKLSGTTNYVATAEAVYPITAYQRTLSNEIDQRNDTPEWLRILTRKSAQEVITKIILDQKKKYQWTTYVPFIQVIDLPIELQWLLSYLSYSDSEAF